MRSRKPDSTRSSRHEFTQLIDLAAERLGGRALVANDELFAPRGNLLRAAEPIFIPDKFTEIGKWMDGWETRRKRVPGHDWCIVKLGLRGIVRGIDAYTRFFTGNYPEHCSLDACDLPGNPGARALAAPGVRWHALLRKSRLAGDSHNLLAVRSARPVTHVRLNIFPDGGVARLRVFGEVVPDWERLRAGSRPIDLAAAEHGGLVLGASDMHFGAKDNLIMPGRGVNMGDGWETRRRRGPGHDWAILRLGTSGALERVVVDTHYFIGNYPESCSIEGCARPAGSTLAALARARWVEVLPRTKLRADAHHVFSRSKLAARGPFSHLRLNIFPDGGISRLRVFGRPE